MNMKTIVSVAAACGCIAFATAAEEPTEAEKGEFKVEDIVSAEFGLKFDSRYLTYGMIDGKDPIVTPSGYLTFFDWVYIGAEAIFDVTKGNGKRGGYGNRAGRWTTLDASVGIAHEFDLGEKFGKLSVDFNYMYEYLERYHSNMGDTQYLNLTLGLSDGIFWVEPKLWIERDLMADDGTYVNLELGHTFPLIERGEESESEDDDEDPVLAFRPSVGQGFGNTQRMRGYSPDERTYDHGGLMDTCIKGELTWKLCPHVKLSAYVAYSDFWFDSNIRDGARERNASWGKGCDHSWNFYGGVGVKVEF